ncbi:hypothetical protein [uncultured Microbacterium sp.]|uniref:Uncharacterized protein n=1 Tax=uncultured Microbacterium sp. TaxID=191216 RepID=A0A1Y5P3F9_9MICO|nr:hypothetical protein [uncultured Microbacterium sp.]SBS71859.1 hypothetical protein MIPYR_20262 [uncultured Microbacterium sp.]
MAGTKEQEFDQIRKHTDQVFGFILCNKFSLTTETMLERAERLWSNSERHLSPNIIVSMTEGFIMPSTTTKMLLSPIGATHVSFREDPILGFAALVRMLNLAYSDGRTVPTSAFDRYLANTATNPADVRIRPLQQPTHG